MAPRPALPIRSDSSRRCAPRSSPSVQSCLVAGPATSRSAPAIVRSSAPRTATSRLRGTSDDATSRRLRALITRVVGGCAARPWLVLVAAAVLGVVACVYAARHIAIDTNTAKLIAPDLPWRQREIDFAKSFPQRVAVIAVVVDGATPDIGRAGDRRAGAAARRQHAAFRRAAAARRRAVLQPRRPAVRADGRSGAHDAADHRCAAAARNAGGRSDACAA